MTVESRENWIEAGQLVAVLTLMLLAAGAVSAIAQQYGGADQTSINLTQATATATLSAQIAALTERIGRIESQINYVFAALVGSLITQLVSLRVGKR